MIEYVIAHNPDDRIIEKACEVLRAGEFVVLPTDTSWTILADPFQKKAVEKLYRLKGEEKSHHFSLLCVDFAKASELAHISDSAFRLIKRHIPGHYTFIFEASKKMIKALKASKTDHQVGLRFVPDDLVNHLLNAYGSSLLCTNIGENILGRESAGDDVYSYELEEILRGKVSMIIDPGELNFVGPSTIYDLREGQGLCLREGAGPKLL